MQQHLVYKNCDLAFELSSEIERSRFDTLFSKEPETIKWIEDFFSEKDIFLDVGANIGIFSLFAGEIHQGLTVYACEPAYHNFYKLCTNILLNNLEPRVFPLGVGLSDHIDFTTLHLSSIQDGSASHSLGSAIAQKQADSKTFNHVVALISLDELISKQIIKPPQHIKIDVDGVEVYVVRGMANYLKNPNLKSVLIELDHKLSDTQEIFQHMEAAGFSMEHPINAMKGHSRERRQGAGHGHIENVIFTRT